MQTDETRLEFECWVLRSWATVWGKPGDLQLADSRIAVAVGHAWEAWLAAKAQQPAPQPLTETVDWEHIARLLDAALQELVVFVDERWSDNECRALENAKHAMGLVKDEW